MLEDLIGEAAKGNPDSFEALYERLSAKTFLFIRARTRTREDALDVLQETFVEFWKSLGRFHFVSEPALYAFLYTLASRRISRQYRKRFWQMEQQREEQFDDVEDILTDEDAEEMRADARYMLLKLTSLPKQDEEVLRLRYIAGLPFRDIAALTGESENTLKVRHHRALLKLRELYRYGTR